MDATVSIPPRPEQGAEADLQREVARLSDKASGLQRATQARAREQAQEKARAAAIQQAVDVRLADEQVVTGADASIATLESYREGFRKATTAMQDRLSQELSLVGNRDAAFERSKLNVEIIGI